MVLEALTIPIKIPYHIQVFHFDSWRYNCNGSSGVIAILDRNRRTIRDLHLGRPAVEVRNRLSISPNTHHQTVTGQLLSEISRSRDVDQGDTSYTALRVIGWLPPSEAWRDPENSGQKLTKSRLG
ncbi:MAG: hypothetical protein Q9164_004606 [Protoblastenia rupestris]